MGSFFTNLHIRNAATKAVCTALQKLDGRAYVSPPSGGWVTVYPECTEPQNDGPMREIASGLSRTFKTDVLGFLVHDSDIAMYWLYRNGDLIDEFNSAPDYFSTKIEEPTDTPLGGDVEAFLSLCKTGTTRAQLEQVLHPTDGFPVMADEIVTELAKLLGINETRASFGFKYFENSGAEVFPEVAKFEPIGGAERQQPRTRSPKYPEIRLPDPYTLAVNMLTQVWNPEYEITDLANADPFLKTLRTQFDRTARDLLKKSKLPNLPTIEELKSARNQGPESLALLLAAKTPDQLAEIAKGAVVVSLEPFLVALLKHGVDPLAKDSAGRSVLDTAAQAHGANSAIYKLVKAAVKKR
jgi:hypothetical protein